MHAVVNHLSFAEPVSSETIRLLREEGLPGIRDAGCLAGHVVQVGADHLILVLLFPDAETMSEATSSAGSPWMRRRIVPLLAAPTQRSVGEVVATSGP